MTSFSSLGVSEPLCRALAAENYSQPTPIQTQAIPAILTGRDLLGIAQTGTGKTAAFAVPLLQKLAAAQVAPPQRGTRALILAPTRELAVQIAQSIKGYSRHLKLRQATVLGGVKINPQIAALRQGVDILIATPGRLLDLIKQNHLQLNAVTTLIVDEADRMLDMGFIRDIRRIVSLTPKNRQTMLFSATMPGEVAVLIGDILKNPERVEVAPQATPAELVEQYVHFVNTTAKRDLLVKLLRDPAFGRVMVFSRTKHGADRIAGQLVKSGLNAEALHGGKSQSARQRVLDTFRSGRSPILVATDIAARGIDVSGVTHVINFDLPNVPEDYVHRIGRTARAGASGIAISFCDGSERNQLRDIEKKMRFKINVVGDTPAETYNPAADTKQDERRFAPKRRRFGAGNPRRRAA